MITMKYLTQREYERKLREIQRENESIERYNKLRQEKRNIQGGVKKPSTDKLIATYLFIILNVVLIYAMLAMWHFADLSYLGVLVTDIAGQVITYYIYAKKATAQNTKGGITYDLAMLEHGTENNNTDSVPNG